MELFVCPPPFGFRKCSGVSDVFLVLPRVYWGMLPECALLLLHEEIQQYSRLLWPAAGKTPSSKSDTSIIGLLRRQQSKLPQLRNETHRTVSLDGIRTSNFTNKTHNDLQ